MKSSRPYQNRELPNMAEKEKKVEAEEPAKLLAKVLRRHREK